MITFEAIPFKWEFIGNEPFFAVRSTPNEVDGRCFKVSYTVSSIPYHIENTRNDIVLTTPYFTITYHVVDYDTQDRYSIHSASTVDDVYEQLIDKVAYNYEINQYYAVYVHKRVNDVLIIFKERITNAHTITDFSFALSYSPNIPLNIILTEGYTAGISQQKRDGYKIFAQLEVDRKQGLIPKIERSEYCFIDQYDKRSKFPLSILNSYFDNIDLPSPIELYQAISLHYNYIKYRLLIAEYYNNTVYYVKRSDQYYMFNGLLKPDKAKLNTPDWEVYNPSVRITNQPAAFNYSTPKESIIRTFRDCPQYVYAANLTNTDETITCSVLINNDATLNLSSLTIPAETICRIPVSLAAINYATPDEVFTYKVTFTNSEDNVIIERTFNIIPKPVNARVLFLQNRHGLIETFGIDNIVIEKEISGENVIVNSRNAIEIDEKTIKVTARTGYKTSMEMQLLQDAIGNKYNYIIDGELVYNINFMTSTYTIIDEKEDLQSCEIQFTIGECLATTIEQIVGDTIITDSSIIKERTIVIDEYELQVLN